MANPVESGRELRSTMKFKDGQEVVYYDPTEAVEEHARNRSGAKALGGLTVDEGRPLSESEVDVARSSGRLLAVAMRGQEDVFSQLKLPVVLPVSASDPDEAMAHARRYLSRAGLSPRDFLSFDLTTHYYIGVLGGRVCGWSFSFSTQPFELTPRFES